jgi:putative endonuclease
MTGLCQHRGDLFWTVLAGGTQLSSVFMDGQPAVYILASKRNGTLYIGVTSDLRKRIWEHREGIVEGFTKKYAVHMLVYYELFTDMYSAITREKRLKKWRRAWKIRLIEEMNPRWDDLWQQIIS